MLRERVERSRLQEPGGHRPDGRQRRRRGWPMRHRARGEWESEEPRRSPSYGRAFRWRSGRGGIRREKTIKNFRDKRLKLSISHLRHKNKDVPKVGHPLPLTRAAAPDRKSVV